MGRRRGKRPPGWASSMLRFLAPRDRRDEVLGDLEEAHRHRLARRTPWLAGLITGLEALDLSIVLLRQRLAGGRSVSVLDLKLGVRMLIKHPGLTLVGGLAMAFGIWLGAVAFEVLNQVVRPTLPLDEGDRVVGVQALDTETGRTGLPFLEDFVTWRDELESIDEVGAFRTRPRNLVRGENAAAPIPVAEMTASGFRVARVPPLLGRTLVDADEAPGAPSVVVIGHELWETRFLGDPGVVGAVVELDGEPHTIVGVMPEGFRFPLSHSVWSPLPRSGAGLQPGQGGPVLVFGRLAPGVTLEEAQADLDALRTRRAAAFPEALGRYRPTILPYAMAVRPLPDMGPAAVVAINAFMVMLLALVCGNVALLVFARAASRENELAVRSALGAGRARIVSQLFGEALVLSAVAAAAGLAVAQLGVRWVVTMLDADWGGTAPFWMSDRLAPETVLYLCVLTVVGAVLTGVLPGIRVTGPAGQARLRGSGGGAPRPRLSGVWTAVVVGQVAVTVAFPATAFFFHRYVAAMQSLDVGFDAEEYLSVRLEMDDGPTERHLADAYRELEERLSEEPDVLGVTFADRLPGTIHPLVAVHVDDPSGPAASATPTPRVGRAAVDPRFFRVLDRPLRAGRGFDAASTAGAGGPVIVNRAFVEEVLGGRNALGRRVRYAVAAGDDPGAWHEIVGVADDLGVIGGDSFLPRGVPGIYHLTVPDSLPVLHMAIRVRGDRDAFAGRLRSMAAAVEPGLRLQELGPLERASESRWRESELLYRLMSGVSIVALILSLSGIYSVTAFTVLRRTREIGVRVALGCDRSRIVSSIFRRPLTQILSGIALGAVFVFVIARGALGALSLVEFGLVGAYALLMLLVSLLACAVPTRRALAVEPTEALRAEA